jgi:hypothetical protein
MESLLLVIALLVLPIILLLANAGCVGEDPVLEAQAKQREAEEKAKDLERQITQEKEAEKAAAEAAKYDNLVGGNANLVSYWRLGEVETGDPTAVDSVKVSPLHGQYMQLQGISRGEKGALALLPDPNDKAAEFLGMQGYVQVPYHGQRNPPLSWSVEFWIKPLVTNSNDPQTIIGSYELDTGGTPVRGFVIDLLRTPGPRVRARIGNGTSMTSLESSLGDGMEHDGWRHVVVTYSGASKSLMIYVNSDDGKPEAQLPSPTAPAAIAYQAITDTTMPLRIGAGQPEVPIVQGAGGNVSNFLAARLDEVALYRVALDGTTIRNHFRAATI